MLLGHDLLVKQLENTLPAVSVITGPPSVGKRLIAANAAIRHNVARIDFTEVSYLTVDEAVRIKTFISTKPMASFKFVTINLDRATSAATDKLLVTLENPPAHARLMLISSKLPPKTIRTRAEMFSVGLLDPESLATILVNRGVPALEAVRLSHLGRVDVALDLYTRSADRQNVLNIFNAVESQDYILLMQAFRGCDDNVASLILTALEESGSRRWKIFDEKSLGVFGKKDVALKLIGAWSTMAGARPQLIARAVLESAMKG